MKIHSGHVHARDMHTEEQSYICGMYVHDVTSVGQCSVDFSALLWKIQGPVIQEGLAALLKMVVRNARQVKNTNKMPFPKYTK